MPPNSGLFRAIFLFLSGVFMLGVFCTCQQGRRTGFDPGNAAPAFSLEKLDGGHGALSDYQGQIVLLNFFASWCEPCVQEAPALQKLHARYQGRGFTVLGVASSDEKQNVLEFRRRFGISFPILLDDGKVAQDKYRTTGFPESFLLDPQGGMLMVNDPAQGEALVRMVGPRDWDSPEIASQVEVLLKNLPRQKESS